MTIPLHSNITNKQILSCDTTTTKQKTTASVDAVVFIGFVYKSDYIPR